MVQVPAAVGPHHSRAARFVRVSLPKLCHWSSRVTPFATRVRFHARNCLRPRRTVMEGSGIALPLPSLRVTEGFYLSRAAALGVPSDEKGLRDGQQSGRLAARSEQKAKIERRKEESMPRSLAVRPSPAGLTQVHDIVEQLTTRESAGEALTALRHLPAREAQWAPMPAWVRPELIAAYRAKGVEQLYTHQAAAGEAIRAGRNVVVVTPTASGKTICYNLPVLNAVLEDPDTRALYMFPTKALAQDQLAELNDLAERVGDRFGVFTYDGDTPSDARKAIREQGHIVLTNPDMLHTGILPHHTRWTRLFENLRYIVLDELHSYRGVFGSHLANVLRRLRRIARFYGREPQFVCCSATIANPGDLASRLIEAEVEVVSSNGAPAAEKTFAFYNPPGVNRDVGALDAAVLAGYPGTIASTWQRAGRAGRRTGGSCAVLVASSSPLDQFIVRHPDYFFGNSPEHAFIQPDNLEILVNHLKCAAFELPLSAEEKFGDVSLGQLCERLAEAGFLHRAGDHWHWTQEAYPADTISLRSVTSDNFVIIDITDQPEVIGEVDFPSALTAVHPKAIYLHQGEQYHVERLDFDERKAYVKRVDVDYFTDAIRYTQVRVLEIGEETHLAAPANRAHGDVLVRSQVVGFKKIKFFTNENVGAGQLELPENEMHTTAYWITLERPLVESLPFTISERQNGMFGLLYALESVAPLLLMCDRRDLGTAIGERPPSPAMETGREEAQEFNHTPGYAAAEQKELFEPNLYLYDAYPGGIC